MCETCGCGDPEIVPIEVQERILSDNDAAVTVLGLYALPVLGGSLVVDGNAQLEMLNIGIHLEGIGGSLQVTNNGELLLVETFPVLTRIGMDVPGSALWLRANHKLLELDAFPALDEVLIHAEDVGSPLRFIGAERTRGVQDAGIDQPAGADFQAIGF